MLPSRGKPVKRRTPNEEPKKPKITLEGTSIEILDGVATVDVLCSVKLSPDFCSLQSSIGFNFKTHAEDADMAARTAFKKVRDLVFEEVEKMKTKLKDVQ